MAGKLPVLSYLALFVCLFAFALTIAVVVRPIYLTEQGPYSGTQRAWYATVTTIAAALFTSFTSSQIQLLWVGRLDLHFNDLSEENQIQTMQSKWSTILRVDSLLDKFRHWKITASFLGTGLITAAIVASTTPSPIVKTIKYDMKVSSGLPYRCANLLDTDKATSGYYFYNWDLENGSTISVEWLAFNCPIRIAVSLMENINAYNPDVFAYSDLGAAVQRTAIGAPVMVYGSTMGASTMGMDQSISKLLGKYGSNAISTTQCVRTMTSNPISCQARGRVDTNGDQPMTVTSSDGNCSITGAHPTGMAKGMCVSEELGRATIVFGTDMYYTRELALAVGEPNISNRPFAVTCSLDVRNVFRYRNVALSLQDTGGIIRTNLGRQLNASTEECGTFQTEDNYGLLAIATMANRWILDQDGDYGFFESISQFTTNAKDWNEPRKPPFAFSNSQNALEDVLGLTTALVTSRVNSSTISVSGAAMIAASRVGSGNRFGLLYAIPPLFAVIILVALMVSNRREGKESTMKLEDLINVGRKSEREKLLSNREIEKIYDSE